MSLFVYCQHVERRGPIDPEEKRRGERRKLEDVVGFELLYNIYVNMYVNNLLAGTRE